MLREPNPSQAREPAQPETRTPADRAGQRVDSMALWADRSDIGRRGDSCSLRLCFLSIRLSQRRIDRPGSDHGTLGTILGGYLGVQTGSQGKEAEIARQKAESRAVAFAAAADYDRAVPALRVIGE